MPLNFMETIETISSLPVRLHPAQFGNGRLARKYLDHPPSAERLVDTYWASFFGCDRDLLLHDGPTQLIPVPDDVGFWAFSRRGGWVVAAPYTFCAEACGQVHATFLPKALPKPEQIHALLSPFAYQPFFGPAAVLLHKRPTWRFPQQPYVRPVTVADRHAVAAFQAETPAVPWTLDEPDTWVNVFGAFVEGCLVASCAVRVWGNLLAEIYVDTAPAQQRRGYGKAVTSAALNWIHTATPYYPESVVDLANYASIKIMKTLGFEPYAYMVNSCPVL